MPICLSAPPIEEHPYSDGGALKVFPVDQSELDQSSLTRRWINTGDSQSTTNESISRFAKSECC